MNTKNLIAILMITAVSSAVVTLPVEARGGGFGGGFGHMGGGFGGFGHGGFGGGGISSMHEGGLGEGGFGGMHEGGFGGGGFGAERGNFGGGGQMGTGFAGGQRIAAGGMNGGGAFPRGGMQDMTGSRAGQGSSGRSAGDRPDSVANRSDNGNQPLNPNNGNHPLPPDHGNRGNNNQNHSNSGNNTGNNDNNTTNNITANGNGGWSGSHPYAAGAASGYAAGAHYGYPGYGGYGWGGYPGNYWPLPLFSAPYLLGAAGQEQQPIVVNQTTQTQPQQQLPPGQAQSQGASDAATAEKARVFAQTFAQELRNIRMQQMNGYSSPSAVQMPAAPMNAMSLNGRI